MTIYGECEGWKRFWKLKDAEFMNVIGLGKAGCAIADKFGEHPQYKIYKIDVGLEGERCYGIKEQPGPEEYEANTPSFKKFFGKISGEALFVVGGWDLFQQCVYAL